MDNHTLIEKTQEQEKKLKLNTQLWFAVKNNDFSQVNTLVDEGATLHQLKGTPLRRYDLDENTLLHIASKQGSLSLVEFFTQFMPVDARNRLQQTPLHWAAYMGHPSVVTYLVQHGADINAVDTDGDTALTWAANKGHIEVVDYLIQQGADPKKISCYGNTALHWTAISGEIAMAKHLIQLGCDISLKNHHGHTPLDLAVENAHLEMVRLLISYTH